MRGLLLAALLLPLVVSVSCQDEGDECATNDDCGPDAYCTNVLCTVANGGACGFAESSSCPRRCEPKLLEGEPCTPEVYGAVQDVSCADGLTCNVALASVCAPPQPLGGACSQEADCRDGACDPITTRCISPGTIEAGAPCAGEEACGPDLTCPPVNPYLARTCLPALPEGASCFGLPLACRDGLSCQDGSCAPPPP